jgi:glycosyltransferase involved in cell wall biosynthesis
MSESIRISVVTPSYNQGVFLGRTLASVASQSYPPHEHLVFDGGSSDETLQVLKAAGPGVRWVSQPDNGQADAVNQGLQAASGDIIGWLNSDDIYYPNAFKTVAETFAADPSLDVLYGAADHIDLDDIPFESYPTTFWDPDLLQHTCFICQPALFFRRRVIERVGLLDANLRYCMDYNYWLRLADANCRFAYIPEKLAGSRLYADNKTLSDRPAVHREIAEMFRSYQGEVPLRWVFAYAHHSTADRLDRSKEPIRFKLHLYLETMRSQWRWNHRIGISALRELRRASRRHALEAAAAEIPAASS